MGYMIDIFKCKHPFNRLGVEKEATEETIDADFSGVTYHLVCNKCGEQLPLEHVKLNGTLQDFFESKLS